MKPRTFSGIQPTNIIHLGNYLGAVKNWVRMQDNYDCIFCVVDLHALTVYQKPEELKKNIIQAAKLYLALGINPKKSIIFQQSKIKEHTELAWILNCIAKTSELERMTQFKDKAKEHKENVNMGLFDYPILMAADILLYQTNAVPVGEDQIQHVELARVLARRFNNLYGQTFIEPQPLLMKTSARIMGLDDSNKKMSKSASSPNNYISLLDDLETIRKKISRAETDSGREIKFGPDKPAISNLLNIYAGLTDKSIGEIEKMYQNKGYAEFKKGLSKVVINFIAKVQKDFYKIKDNEVEKILTNGAEKVQKIASKQIKIVQEKIGLSTDR